MIKVLEATWTLFKWVKMCFQGELYFTGIAGFYYGIGKFGCGGGKHFYVTRWALDVFNMVWGADELSTSSADVNLFDVFWERMFFRWHMDILPYSRLGCKNIFKEMYFFV